MTILRVKELALPILVVTAIVALLVRGGAVPAVADQFGLETPALSFSGDDPRQEHMATPECSRLDVLLRATPAPATNLSAAPAYTGCGGGFAPPVNAEYEQQVVELVNAERANAGLPPLKRATPLDQAARYHATDMGQDDYFDHATHDRVDGQSVYVCAWDTRIGTYYANREWLAENIAYGLDTPQRVMQGWMGSPGHRDNILHREMWEIGVGYSEGSSTYRRHWVQDFGRRSGVYPLVINGEAAATDSRVVSLYAYGDWNEIRLRNNDGAWGGWQTFHNTLTWTLSGASGEQTVWAEMRSGGQRVVSSDSIYFIGSAVTPSPTPTRTRTPTPTPTPGEMSPSVYLPIITSP